MAMVGAHSTSGHMRHLGHCRLGTARELLLLPFFYRLGCEFLSNGCHPQTKAGLFKYITNLDKGLKVMKLKP